MIIDQYIHTLRYPNGREFTYPSADAFHGRTSPLLVRTVRIRYDLKVGDPVAVRAFGRMRSGHVVKTGRTKITVEFVRNQSGDLSTRWFGAADIGVTDGTPHTTDVIFEEQS